MSSCLPEKRKEKISGVFFQKEKFTVNGMKKKSAPVSM